MGRQLLNTTVVWVALPRTTAREFMVGSTHNITVVEVAYVEFVRRSDRRGCETLRRWWLRK